MTKIYVAGGLNNREDIHRKIKQLLELGYEITHDWTQLELPGASEDEYAARAALDIGAVLAGDVVIALMVDKDYAYRGTFTEVGCALGARKRVIIVCPHEESYSRNNCFFHHPDIIRVKEWEEALERIIEN